jgi:hypothetical protein
MTLRALARNRVAMGIALELLSQAALSQELSGRLRRTSMIYTKKFARSDDLRAFLHFHREETGLLFHSDGELNTAWIEADEKICRELEFADR